MQRSDLPTASLKKFPHSNKCELNIALTFPRCITFGEKEHEITAVTEITDSVGSLLRNLHSKIVITNKSPEIEDFTINNGFQCDGCQVEESVTCDKLFHLRKLNLVVFDQNFRVLINAPLVQEILLPPIIYVKYLVQPVKIKTINTHRDLSKIEWYKSKNGTNWTKICNKYTYKVQNSDIGHYLKFCYLPKNNDFDGPVFEIVSENQVRKMQRLEHYPFNDRQKLINSHAPDNEFRVLSYNILSSRYSETNANMPYCPNEYLNINYRKGLLVNEIVDYFADIICLQEVDHKEYINFFNKELRKTGYESAYDKKGNKLSEGLCTAYRRDKFREIERKHLVFNEEIRKEKMFKFLYDIMDRDEELKSCFLKQSTSLQITILKANDRPEIIVVANTHLYYHSEAAHVRLLQAAMATTYLKHRVQKLKKSGKSRVSVLFCGDFNSVPPSAVYEFLSTGQVDHNHKDCQKYKIDGNFKLYHDFNFTSACGTPDFTNYTEDFKGCIDYIFYDSNNIRLTSYVPFPSEDLLSANVALPSQLFPSDHLALIADLKWIC